jgi:hypothetical protein
MRAEFVQATGYELAGKVIQFSACISFLAVPPAICLN